LKYAVDVHLFKLQRLQNRLLRATGNIGRCTPVRELHMAFKIPYVYDYITILCRTLVEIKLNHVNPNLRGIGQGEAMHGKYEARLNLCGG
jgi:hypothetical protein